MHPWETAPARYDELLREKCATVEERFIALGAPAAEIYSSPVDSYRVRAEFRIWHDGDRLDYVMFDPQAPREPVAIVDFVPAVRSIRAVMPDLGEALESSSELRRKLFQVEFLAGDAELLVTLIYHRPLDEEWVRAAEDLALRLNLRIIGRSRKQKIVLSDDFVVQSYTVGNRSYRYRQYEQSFVQPNGPVNEKMLAWVWDKAGDASGDLLELYCGNGNFTLPLASRFRRVLATELSKIGIRAAKENAEANAVDNIQVARLSAEEVSEAIAGKREFRRLAGLTPGITEHVFTTVFVDPPRAGLDDATLACVQNFDRILYISCNPVTLLENLKHLSATHRIQDLAFFDQFPYTHHLESGVYLERRQAP